MNIVIGIVLTFVGAVLTIARFSSANAGGGFYALFGLIGFGLALLGKGASQFKNGER